MSKLSIIEEIGVINATAPAKENPYAIHEPIKPFENINDQFGNSWVTANTLGRKPLPTDSGVGEY